MRINLAALAVISALALPSVSMAHSGGLNADGCHNNRKTGDYHCHRSPTPQANLYSSQPRTTSGNVYYPNCAAARAAGAAPVRRGEPGYAAHLDRDNDGIGCE